MSGVTKNGWEVSRELVAIHRDFIFSNPKLSIWLSGIALLSVVYIQADLQRLMRKNMEFNLEFAQLIKSNKPVQPIV